MAAPMKVGVILKLPRHLSILSCGCSKFPSSIKCVRWLFPELHKATTFQQYHSGISTQDTAESNASFKGQKISQAMRAYLKKAHAYEAMMTKETAEFELGRRHLANIMGVDADSFTQDDIDKAIEYLLPSGLTDKKARPMLKPPLQVFPIQKAAAFSPDGRPFHSFFYTMKPNFYKLMYDTGFKLDQLQKKGERKYINDAKEREKTKVFMAGSKWVDKKRIANITNEKITELDYKKFITLLERLAVQDYSLDEKEFIFQFRYSFQAQSMFDTISPPLKDEHGREYQEAIGKRKTSTAKVRVYKDGTGQFIVNGSDDLLNYFYRIIDRQQLMFPLQFVGLLGQADVYAEVESGGTSSQAGAIRLATSRALQSFLERETLEKMRLAGLLTSDPRRKERKKYGQAKARKKYPWKRR